MKLACGKEHRDDPHRGSSPALSAIDSRDLDFRLPRRLGKQDRGRSPLFHKEKNLPALLHRIEHSAQTNWFGHLYHRLFHGENPPYTKSSSVVICRLGMFSHHFCGNVPFFFCLTAPNVLFGAKNGKYNFLLYVYFIAKFSKIP